MRSKIFFLTIGKKEGEKDNRFELSNADTPGARMHPKGTHVVTSDIEKYDETASNLSIPVSMNAMNFSSRHKIAKQINILHTDMLTA